MPNVGFHRTYVARLTAVSTHHFSNGIGFKGIPHKGSRTMGFYIFHLSGIHPGILIGHSDHLLLRFRTGNGYPFGGSILVDSRSPDGGIDAIPVFQGTGEGFDHDHSGTLTANVAVGPGIKSIASAVGRKKSPLGEAHLRLGL